MVVLNTVGSTGGILRQPMKQRMKCGAFTFSCELFPYVTWRPRGKLVHKPVQKLIIVFMTLNEERACCKSRKRSLDTCIDGNACKENTTDKRWVGIDTHNLTIFFSRLYCSIAVVVDWLTPQQLQLKYLHLTFLCLGTSRSTRPIPIR